MSYHLVQEYQSTEYLSSTLVHIFHRCYQYMG